MIGALRDISELEPQMICEFKLQGSKTEPYKRSLIVDGVTLFTSDDYTSSESARDDINRKLVLLAECLKCLCIQKNAMTVEIDNSMMEQIK